MAIQPLDPNEDDFLMDEVLASKRSARRRSSVEQIQYDLWQAEKKRAILRASPSERDT